MTRHSRKPHYYHGRLWGYTDRHPSGYYSASYYSPDGSPAPYAGTGTPNPLFRSRQEARVSVDLHASSVLRSILELPARLRAAVGDDPSELAQAIRLAASEITHHNRKIRESPASGPSPDRSKEIQEFRGF